MAIKTFNVEEDIYQKFSSFCKDNGVSMSKQINTFMAYIVADTPKARKEYLEKLNFIRQGRFIKVKDFNKRYKL